jgi:hypothetical protein
MAKAFDFNWRPSVPSRLIKGDLFDRWDEVKKELFLFCPAKLNSSSSTFQQALICNNDGSSWF